MPVLFERLWEVKVNGLDVSGLDSSFQIFKSTKREPNTCQLSVINLSADTRQQLEELDNPRIEVKAGYVPDAAVPGAPPRISTLFVGDARSLTTEHDGITAVTTFEARDRGRAYQRARINQSFAAGSTVEQVLRAAVLALGVGEGNLSDFTAGLALENGAGVFPEGYVASGSAQRVVDEIVRGAGLRWSVQNGVLTIRRRGQPLQTTATLISVATGMVGAPAAGDRGTVNVVSLIQGGLDPGRKVVLQSRQFSGGYEIRAAEYVGDTAGNDWYANLELKPF